MYWARILHRPPTAPVASTVRNVRPRLEMVNDDGMDASLTPTLVVPPTVADPADRFFLPGAVGGLETVDDDDLDNLLPGTMVVAPTPVHLVRRLRDRLGSLFTQGCELASTLAHPEENIDDMGIVAATEALKKHKRRACVTAVHEPEERGTRHRE